MEDCRKLHTGQELTVLLAGTEAGHVYVLIDGFLLVMCLQPTDMGVDVNGAVEHLAMTEDTKYISAVVGQRLLLLSCPLLATCMPELAVLASKFSLVQGRLAPPGHKDIEVRPRLHS